MTLPVSTEGLKYLHWLQIFVAAIAHNGPIEISEKALVAAPRLTDNIIGSLVIEEDIGRATYTFKLLDAPGTEVPYYYDD